MLDRVEKFSRIFLEKARGKRIYLVSHFDTDGVSSAAIASKVFERLDLQFSVKILKSLSDEEIDLFPDDGLIVILDLGSGSFDKLAESGKEIFIIDHHELESSDISENIDVLNFHLIDF